MLGIRFLALVWLAFLLCGCAVRASVDRMETLTPSVNQDIEDILEHGDWLVSRGVNTTDDLVSILTNTALSHAAIYDAQTGQVIEADSQGVHATLLADFIGKSYRILVIKPMWATPENRPLAVRAARSHLGKKYDYTGLIGLGFREKYYCTELVIDVYKNFIGNGPKNPLPPVITPGQMYHWGRIAFDSGP